MSKFDDMLFNGKLGGTLIVNPETLPRYAVSIRRTGTNGLGEDMCEVKLHRYERTFDGSEPDIEEHIQRWWDEAQRGEDPNLVLKYTAELDKAQGYAQGMFDGLQVALGLAGRTPEAG